MDVETNKFGVPMCDIKELYKYYYNKETRNKFLKLSKIKKFNKKANLLLDKFKIANGMKLNSFAKIEEFQSFFDGNELLSEVVFENIVDVYDEKLVKFNLFVKDFVEKYIEDNKLQF